ncbi:alpha/beta fold hydrolase [Pseudoduganella namucuonensis]|uniref:4,5:9,10-diseco-3-hydroxy-5,9,17-trioxoandrosta-1(10),2-diene-4-oate hydrolase n=1 Tax=Pseudoduganella namucuonensis TaxID=1035707 RepID=A0A1I7M5R9_9BURK|nr:alpha/beta hydrolase [Pseudoduganella namucuonensis]SFV17283.1 4,5:9,10-diseco-3-hydroxy-5,9,17-trioxoandrosta-1(10),2-diene-4-oate hydrolase [Pseudoduganella namucuonensis]
MASIPSPIPMGKFVHTAGGLDIHYHEAGDGPPVVFIHGSGPGASGYSNFKLNYPRFAEQGYRVIVPDLPGYGLSSKPEDVEYVLAFFVSALREFLDQLGIERCVLLGNSLGGAIAMQYALDHPRAVSKLILMAPGGLEERETYFQMRGIQDMVASFAGGAIDTEGMRHLLSLLLYDKELIDDALLAERVGVCALQPRGVLSTMRVPNLSERLGEITCPVLGFWGMNDLFCPPGGALKVARQCPNARFMLVNQCGHWVMVEHRAMFDRNCIDFLNHD